MPRFTLFQLLLGIALLALLLAFTQAEGCGEHFAMIESLCFSAGDSRIAVTKLNARDAQAHFKIYKANVSRTISWLDASAGKRLGLIHQSFKSGNCGPAFELWRVGRTSALCSPANDQVAISDFGGGNLTRNVNTARPTVISLQHPALNIAFSRSGRFLAGSGHSGITVLDTENDTVVLHARSDGIPFLDASQMSFTNDESRVVLAGSSGVHVWDLAGGTQVSTLIHTSEPVISRIAVTREDHVVVCSNEWVRLYDLEGKLVDSVSEKGARLCSIARDDDRLAVSDGDGVTVFDLSTGRVVCLLECELVTSLALSSNGHQLADGDYNGRVTLFETSTGTRRWSARPPGRYRMPWTLPGAILAVWFWIAWRLARKKERHPDARPTRFAVPPPAQASKACNSDVAEGQRDGGA
jgi:WD40 repeat protein